MIHITMITILVVLKIMCGLVSTNNEASCPESTLSAVYVESCPRTVDEWREAGNRKNCKQIAHSCKSFEYHCVINAWKNVTVEVCAPSQLIIGKVCAEFNFGGNRIQRNDNTKCQKCPEVYNSSDALRNPECYDHVKRTEQINNSQRTKQSLDVSSDSYTTRYVSMLSQENVSFHVKTNLSVVIGLSVTALVVLVFLIILIAFLCIGRCQRQTEENQQTQGIFLIPHCIPLCFNSTTGKGCTRVVQSSKSDEESNMISEAQVEKSL
ncbi:uncharacterized protein LOC128183631 [Crassostrea angulata]|uniref:uncharacterized protein LOC128183631 n=1 Tax=Magallana angulata TaxID=2784310 RepID=UPI0022B0DB37|nr:uncharacterized protein LOC128183631 [Crassostrea angulata]